MKRILTTLFFAVLCMAANAQNPRAEKMLDRFLGYVKMDSQSIVPNDDDPFPLTDGQKELARFVYDEIKSLGSGVEVNLSPDYYVYAHIPSNMKRECPSVLFLAHLDVTPDCPGLGVKPQVHRNYDGKDIVLNDTLTIHPDDARHTCLKSLKGKTIVTSDGTTLLGGDCKSGCAILVTSIEEILKERKTKHGDIYYCFTQNEETGICADRMDMSYFKTRPDVLIDVDGPGTGEFSKSNFYAINPTVWFRGDNGHPANAKHEGFADARYAAACFLASLPVECHPLHSEGLQGYLYAYNLKTIDDHDIQVSMRLRYFDKADSATYVGYINDAVERTKQLWPGVKVETEIGGLLYDNVAHTMHPMTIPIIEKTAERTGIAMKAIDLRAGSTAALMAARGLPGGTCLASGQHNEHTEQEWVCIEEMLDMVRFVKELVNQVTLIKK